MLCLRSLWPAEGSLTVTVRPAGLPKDRLRGVSWIAVARAARPMQWPKNLLVFAAPLMAGAPIARQTLFTMTVLCAGFCLTASGVYLMNDVRDAPLDRRHPSKRLRPVASGILSPATAAAAAGSFMAAGLALTSTLGSIELVAVQVVYLAVSVLYCFVLKNVAVLDLVAVAACLMLRVIAGVIISHARWPLWLTVTTCCGVLFVVAGKRYGEAWTLGERRAETRPVLLRYSLLQLRRIWALSAIAAFVSYAAWALDGDEHRGDPWLAASSIPVLLGLFRYASAVRAGDGGSPERVIFSDPALLAFALAWAILLVARVWR
jgi:decaprenyl-phosphate phosphoribosyltransferase